MKDIVEKILMEYRECTSNIIEILKKDDFSALEGEIKKRQKLLNQLLELPDEKEQAKSIYVSLQIEKLQDEAQLLMKKKSALIKKKLADISRNKIASSAYGNPAIGFANIFSKKI